MRVRVPTSVQQARCFFRTGDVVSVLIAPVLATVLRYPDLFISPPRAAPLLYFLFGAAFGMLTLYVFRLEKPLADDLSLEDLKTILWIAVSTAGATACAVFPLVGMHALSKSLPLIHSGVLILALLLGRLIGFGRQNLGLGLAPAKTRSSEDALIVGADELCWRYVRMLEALKSRRTIVAIVDDDPNLVGKSLANRPVVATTSNLPQVITEYKNHGVAVSVVVLTTRSPNHCGPRWDAIRAFCESEGVRVVYLDDLLGPQGGEQENALSAALAGPPAQSQPGYRFAKRAFDVVISISLLIALSPLLAIAALSVLVDVGWPILFWQRRIGYRGEPFFLYKFRTLRAPFDRSGAPVSEERRASRVGALLARTRFDEIPQLFSVLAGEMSFVGPRPLLPIDQPRNSRRRFEALPGLTGWAQVHGGKLLNPEEKGLLDDWYVANASFWLDMRIVLKTIAIVLLGGADRRPAELGGALESRTFARAPPRAPQPAARAANQQSDLLSCAAHGLRQ